jgi:hypothetical protein
MLPFGNVPANYLFGEVAMGEARKLGLGVVLMVAPFALIYVGLNVAELIARQVCGYRTANERIEAAIRRNEEKAKTQRIFDDLKSAYREAGFIEQQKRINEGLASPEVLEWMEMYARALELRPHSDAYLEAHGTTREKLNALIESLYINIAESE